MKRKKALSVSVVAIILGVILVIGVVLLLDLVGDRWTKDKKGVWVKQGEPKETPQEVLRQQEAIKLALELYEKEKASGRILTSQCLGTVNRYAVDIVHNPRSQEDNLLQNQCKDFYEGRVSKFIEIDAEGNIRRVYD